MDLSNDHQYLLSASLDGDVRLWSITNMCCVVRSSHSFSSHSFYSHSFFPFSLFPIHTQCTYSFSRLPLSCLHFSHSNHQFVCGGMDCRVYLGHTSQPNSPQWIGHHHHSELTWCGFSANDNYLISVDMSGVVRFVNRLSG